MAEHHVVSADPLMVDFDLGSLRGQYTSSEDFYVRNHAAIPASVDGASVRISGAVSRPLEITPERLANLKKRRVGAVLECAGNLVKPVAKVSDGIWEGWSLNEAVSYTHLDVYKRQLNLWVFEKIPKFVPLSTRFHEKQSTTPRTVRNLFDQKLITALQVYIG